MTENLYLLLAFLTLVCALVLVACFSSWWLEKHFPEKPPKRNPRGGLN